MPRSNELIVLLEYVYLHKLFKPSAVKEVRWRSSSQQVVSGWNSLPCDVVVANFIRIIKAHFDDYNKDIIYLYD